MQENNLDSISIKITGPAGAGIVTLGDLLCSALNKEGYYSLVYSEYPSRIRGGDNNVQIVFSNKPNLIPKKKVDMLFGFSQELIDLHKDDLSRRSMVFSVQDLNLDKIPEVLENPLVLNSAVAGYIWKLFFPDTKKLSAEIEKSIKKSLVKINLKAVESGFNLNNKTFKLPFKKLAKTVISKIGNELFANACEQAGCEYASIYPMTPITSFLALLNKEKIKLINPEDEIFAAISTLGASYAGRRSITATSGGGFCLMTEAIGFSAMAEIPMVVLLGQRTGPSSGIPTYTSQADLEFAIHSSHGESEKIVLAPGDPEEISTLTQEAFNLADQYQIPVILMTDKYLSECRFSYQESDFKKIKIDRGKRSKKTNKSYLRYKIEKDGISSRAFPGETSFVTSSYEHDERGYSTESVEIRRLMNGKRSRKIKISDAGYKVFGDRKSKKVVVGWGSTKTHLLKLIEKNSSLKFIHIYRPWPLPVKLERELDGAKKIVVFENNSTAQLGKMIKQITLTKVESVLKDDGRPFFEEEILKVSI